MREMVEEIARQTRTPDALSAVVAIGVTAAAIGRGLLVNSGGSRQTAANLYLLAIARSGVGKGQTFSHVSKPLYAAEAEAADEWKKSALPNIEARFAVAQGRTKKAKEKAISAVDEEARKVLIQSLADLEQEQRDLEDARDSCPRYVVGDITREALAMTLAAQPNEALACFSSEARGILGVIRGRYGNGDSSDEDIYLSAYSGDAINVTRIKRPPVSLRHPCLTVIWMTQPDAAQGLLGDERMTVSGLLPRFLICDVKAEPQYEPETWPEIRPAAVASWTALIKSLLGYRASTGEPILIEPTADARRILRDFHNEAVDRARTGGDLHDVDSYVVRWGENAWRLALVLHCAEHGGDAHRKPLDQLTAVNAVNIIRWFNREQLAILAVSRSGRFNVRLAKLEGVLRDAGGCKTLGQLKDANGFEADEVENLARLFPLRLTVETQQKRGRPSPVACLISRTDKPDKPD